MKALICIILGHRYARRSNRRILPTGVAYIAPDAVCLRCGCRGELTGREKWSIEE